MTKTDETALGPHVAALVEEKFGAMIGAQMDRHASALQFGLVRSAGQCDDLDLYRLEIDGSLARILEGEGIDILSVAKQVYGSQASSIELYFPEQIVVELEDRFVTILHDGIGAPFVVSTVALDTACYDGENLEIACTFPEAMASTAAGRPLGALVRTGWDRIDARKVRAVLLDEQKRRWPPTEEPLTKIVMESDRVSLLDLLQPS